MAEPEPIPTDEDAIIDLLAGVDEQLIQAGDPSTAMGGDSVDDSMADCLRLLSRVQQAAPRWPGRSDTWTWLHQDDAAPRQIGRFQIRRRLGMGGFGIVFLAHDPSLDREVALKVPRLEALVSPEARARFLRESKLAASLAHPNIAAVYEAGFVEPAAYIATAYCPGGSLVELIQDEHGPTPLPPRTAAHLIMAVAQATQHAHSRGVLHRDIKPSNILIDAAPEQLPQLLGAPTRLAAAARLVDFGLARSLQTTPDQETLDGHTQTGAMLGTPAYMSPEQVVGNRTEITEAADIYALGATLYCLLVGEPPFRRSSSWETLQALQNDSPTAPGRCRQGIPRDLDAICLKCLEKEPAHRYRTASDLEADLRRFLDGEPIVARPLSPWQRGGRWCRRNPALSTSLLLLCGVLVTATVLSTFLWRRSVAAQRKVASSAQEAERQSVRVRQAVDGLLTAIAEEPSLRSEGMEPFRRKLLLAANDFYDQIRDEPSTNRDVISEHAETLARLAGIHRMLGDHRRALKLWEETIDIVQQSFPEDRTRLAFLLGEQSQELQAVGDYASAAQLALQALQLQRAVGGETEADQQTQTVRLLMNLAQNLLTAQSNEEANRVMDEAMALVEQITGQPPSAWPPDKLWGILLRDKARALSALHQLEESDQMARLSMELIEQHLQQCPADRSACLMHLAALRRTLGNNRSQAGEMSAAAEQYRLAYDLALQLVEQHPDVGMLHDYVVTIGNALAESLIGQPECRQLIEDNRQRIEHGRQQFPDLESQWKTRQEELDSVERQRDMVSASATVE